MNPGRPTRALVYAEYGCTGCGIVVERLVSAALTPDGRLGTLTEYPDGPVLCDPCNNAANAARFRVSRPARGRSLSHGRESATPSAGGAAASLPFNRTGGAHVTSRTREG